MFYLLISPPMPSLENFSELTWRRRVCALVFPCESLARCFDPELSPTLTLTSVSFATMDKGSPKVSRSTEKNSPLVSRKKKGSDKSMSPRLRRKKKSVETSNKRKTSKSKTKVKSAYSKFQGESDSDSDTSTNTETKVAKERVSISVSSAEDPVDCVGNRELRTLIVGATGTLGKAVSIHLSSKFQEKCRYFSSLHMAIWCCRV